MELQHLLCLTIGARFADRTEKYGTMVSLGTIVAGLGCLAALFSNVYVNPTTAVVLAIASLGVGHAFTLTSQNSIIQQVAERYRYTLGRAAVIGAYRLCERLGMVAGPMIAVALISGIWLCGCDCRIWSDTDWIDQPLCHHKSDQSQYPDGNRSWTGK